MIDQRYFVFFKPDGTPQQDMNVCVAPGEAPPSIPGTTCMEVDQESGVSLQNMRLVDGEVVEIIQEAAPDASEVESARVRAKHRLQRAYSEAVAKGFTWKGKPIDASPTSRAALQLYISSASAAIAAGHEFPTIEFTCSDNSTISIVPSDWSEIGALLATHLNAQHVKYQSLKAMVRELQSVESLDQLKW